jgi:hypothetical protein
MSLDGFIAGPGDSQDDAPVWFCDPWPHPFGLAGLEGFLRHFTVTIRACDEYLDIDAHRHS